MKITQREGLLFVELSITHHDIMYNIQDVILDTGAAHPIRLKREVTFCKK